jgi:hypothetical protein
MSKIIATSAIEGAYKIVERAEKTLKECIEKHGKDQKLEFPNT